MIALLVATLAWAAPLTGVVKERGSGDALAGVAVQAGTATTRSTARGDFSLDLPPGAHQVEFLSPDHDALRVEVVLPADEPLLVFLSRLEAPLEIVVESFRPTAHPTRHAVDAEMAWETPGNHEDAVRLVQSMPGVSVRREYAPGAGDLYVRGSAPGDNRYYLDGIELPFLYHFRQYASVFPASRLDRLELFPSTFGSAYGDSVGAVIEAVTRSDRPTGVHGDLTLTSIMAGGLVRAPLSRDWWATASARRSYLDLITPSTEQYTVWPDFNDFALRLDHGGASSTTSVFGFGAGDAYTRAAGEVDLLDPVETGLTPTFRFRRSFQVLGGEHRWQGEGSSGRVVLAGVRSALTGELSDGARQRERSTTASSRLDASGPLPSGAQWGAGWELGVERTDLVVEGASGRSALLVAAEAPALARGRDLDERRTRVRGGVYTEVHLPLGPIRLIPGLRMAVDSRDLELLPEPRLTARWQAADQTALKLAMGRYHQSPDTVDLLTASGDLPTTRSWQIGGGVEQTVAGRLELGVDAYRKWLTEPLRFPVGEPVGWAERGDAWGVELLVRYRLRERVFMWGWLSWARSTLEVDGSRIPGLGDQPLSAGLVFSWDLDRRWNLGLRYRHGTGLPYTTAVDSTYDATADRWIPVLGPENGARMPSYHKVDLRVARTWEMRRWSLQASLEAWVVPPGSSQLYPVWSYDYREQGWVRGPPVVPVVGTRARF